MAARTHFHIPEQEELEIEEQPEDDESAARSLAAFGQLPFRPGTLADAHPPQRPNEVYETDLKLIFFDDGGGFDGTGIVIQEIGFGRGHPP